MDTSLNGFAKDLFDPLKGTEELFCIATTTLVTGGFNPSRTHVSHLHQYLTIFQYSATIAAEYYEELI